MDLDRFDVLTRALTACGSRRALLGALAAGLALHDGTDRTAGKKKKKKKKGNANTILCRSDGSHCVKQSKTCTTTFCLNPPFTIEARWSNPDSDHEPTSSYPMIWERRSRPRLSTSVATAPTPGRGRSIPSPL